MLHRKRPALASFFCPLLLLATLLLPAPSIAAGKLNELIHLEPFAFPEGRFLDREGTEYSIADWKGEVLVVNFWATWCPPCIKELPALKELDEAYGDKLRVVAISEDFKGFEDIDKLLARQEIEHPPFYLDDQMKMFIELKLQGLPNSFIIDQEGNAVIQVRGEIDWNGEKIKEVIDELLKDDQEKLDDT